MSTNVQERPADRLVYEEAPVAQTRSQWVAVARQGRVQRLAGRRYVVRHDRHRGVNVIAPVRLVD